MKIHETELPKNSILNVPHDKYDYADSYQGTLTDKDNNISPTDIVKAFFTSGPKWVGALLVIRNKIVGVFGLKTGDDTPDLQEELDTFACEPNQQLGLFKVFDKSEHEVILGEDDKHLNFRISLLIENSKSDPEKKEVTISTTVVFNNWFGKLYFLPVKTFHKLIVKRMLKATIKELENSQTLMD